MKIKLQFIVLIIILSVSGFVVMNYVARKGMFTSLSKQLMQLTFAKEIVLPNDVTTSEGGYTYALDEVKYYSENNILLVRGWIIRRGIKSIPADRIVILSSETSPKAFRGLTTSRGDVTRSIGDGIDYDASGYDTLIPIAEMQPGTYSLSIAILSDHAQVDTNYYIAIDDKGDVIVSKIQS